MFDMITTMRLRVILICLASCPWAQVGAQGFINMDFEQAIIQPIYEDPALAFLEWDLAVPGWSHSNASDTEFVYYRDTHLGTTPAYLLVDSQSPWWSPGSLEGDYSLYFRNGNSSYDRDSTWVYAFIAQTGAIPANARSVRLLAQGLFQVYVNDTQIPMLDLGRDAYGGDISAFAGTVGELRVVNMARPIAAEVNSPVVVDAITFSPEPVPEPASLALLLCGGMVLCAMRRSACRITRCAE